MHHKFKVNIDMLDILVKLEFNLFK